MKLRKSFANISVGIFTFFLGLVWFGVLQTESSTKLAIVDLGTTDKIEFDIRDSGSVLLIDYNEERLSDPNKDERNERSFDSSGFYFSEELPEELEEFAFIEIRGKQFGISGSEQIPQNFESLIGNIIIDDWRKDEEDRLTFLKLENIEIENGNLFLKTEPNDKITYEFRGKFTAKGNFFALNKNAKVLVGKLVKLKGNSVLAENELEFSWTHTIGCCLR